MTSLFLLIIVQLERHRSSTSTMSIRTQIGIHCKSIDAIIANRRSGVPHRTNTLLLVDKQHSQSCIRCTRLGYCRIFFFHFTLNFSPHFFILFNVDIYQQKQFKSKNWVQFILNRFMLNLTRKNLNANFDEL